MPISSYPFFYIERQAWKLWIPTFKVYWSHSPGNRTQVYRLRGGHSNH